MELLTSLQNCMAKYLTGAAFLMKPWATLLKPRASFSIITVNCLPEASCKVWLLLSLQADWNAARLLFTWKRLGITAVQDLRLSRLPTRETLCLLFPAQESTHDTNSFSFPRSSAVYLRESWHGVIGQIKYKAFIYRSKTNCHLKEPGRTV